MEFETLSYDVDGAAVAVRAAGAGKPVVYLHSAGGFVPTRPLRELAGERRVLAPVAPGFDGTADIEGIDGVGAYADFVARLLDRHVGEKVDVIGSSFGSWVALWLAASRPDLVDHLILGVPAGFRFDGKGGLPADADARFKALHAHPERIDVEPKSADTMAANRACYERLAGGITVDEALDARLPAIEAVTLILLGTEDPVVPQEAGAHLKRSIPQSQRVFVYDAAHAIESDQPERVSRLWRLFLEWGPGFVLNRAA